MAYKSNSNYLEKWEAKRLRVKDMFCMCMNSNNSIVGDLGLSHFEYYTLFGE